jgi:hypothetical protein
VLDDPLLEKIIEIYRENLLQIKIIDIDHENLGFLRK